MEGCLRRERGEGYLRPESAVDGDDGGGGRELQIDSRVVEEEFVSWERVQCVNPH